MRGIRKAFPGVVALAGVDLTLGSGEVHMLLGENGAGKSTLMKILSGAYRKDSGEIRIRDQAVEITSPRHALELGIRVIYQELNLVPQLSVAENIFLGVAPTRLPGVIDRRKLTGLTTALLADLGMNLEAGTPLSRLSLAQRQMVEIAKALRDPSASILVMDEPTSALTSREVDQLFVLIERLVERGVAVVYITHRLDEVYRIGQRVTVLRDGANVATSRLSDVTVAELVRLMANRDLSEHFPRRRGAPGADLLAVEHVGRNGVLRDISFTLRAGEIVGVAGLLGAGRSELARVLAGADRADTGRIICDGKAVVFRSPADAIAKGIGLLPEDRKAEGLVAGLTVARNVALPHGRRLATAVFCRRAAEERLADPVIADLRVKATSTQEVRLLSGGNQQKVVLGKWLAGAARIFIFDEPTRGVDVGTKVEIYQLMNRLTESGAGIVMISSELPELLGMSDRILVMRGGTIQAEFDAADATQERVLSAALGLRRSRAVRARRFGTLIGLLLLCAVLWALTPHFLTLSNLLNVVQQTSINAIVAAGMTFVIISGGIDLSVGSIVALSGVALGTLLQGGYPPAVALPAALAAGIACGLLNGALVSIGRLPPFIATLGMMSVARGAALVFTEGRPVSGFDEGFRWLATGSVGFVPAPVLVMLIVYAVAHFVLTRTTFGRYVYAIGGNEEATRLSGIAVRFHKTAVYGVSGLMSAVAAIVLTARLNSAQPIAGMMYELDAIAATVIGGTSLMGGEGSLGGTLIGALIMGVLRNGLNLLGVSSFLQQIVIGGVIVGAVLVDTILKRHRALTCAT